MTNAKLSTNLEPFALKSWLRSYRAGYQYRGCRDSYYYAAHTPIAQRLLARSEVLTCLDPYDLDHVYAYLVYEHIDDTLILHYFYTKKTYRDLGLAKSLLDQCAKKTGATRRMVSHYSPVSFVQRLLEAYGFECDISLQN